NAEAVLIDCILEGISPVGWGAMGGDTTNMHYWEHHSTNASDGTLADVSQRKPESKQLTVPKDSETIANYRNPAFVLGGAAQMAPLISAQPGSVAAAAGQSVVFTLTAAAIPDAVYQWSKNGVPIRGATQATLAFSTVKTSDAGRYTVGVSNSSGRVT